MHRLDAHFRFDTYVVGAANRLAAAAARAVAEAPGTAYNPLVIQGGPGLGKTHLAAAVARGAREQRPSMRVEYAPFDELVEDLHAAVAAGRADAARERWAGADLLVLDDLHALTLPTEAQGELVRVVTALLAEGRQLVLTCDRPPSAFASLDARLATRFAAGLVVDVGVPDVEMRLDILRGLCAARALVFGGEVLETLAANPFPSVRELQGALNRLAAHQGLAGQPVRAHDVVALLGLAAPSSPSVSDAPAASSAGASTGGIFDDDPDFASFVADVAREVEAHVETWRVRVGEAVAHWQAEGFATEVLERALRLPTAPDVDGLLATFEAAVARLRAAEAEAASLDPRLAGSATFRDPARLAVAESAVARARAVAARAATLVVPAPARPDAAPAFQIDAETFVLEWPDVGALLVEDAA